MRKEPKANIVNGNSRNALKSRRDLDFLGLIRVLVKISIMAAFNVTTEPMTITVDWKPSRFIDVYAMVGNTIPPVAAPQVASDTASARFLLK